ncbi:MAG: TolC family protein [Leptospiraceae bacterium]|nr:TolC family protein [Leptospiraceae bacterium]
MQIFFCFGIFFLISVSEIYSTKSEDSEDLETESENLNLPDIESYISKWNLEELEEYSVSNNPLYLAEKQNINSARGDLITASLYRNPMLTFQEQFISTGNSNSPNIFGYTQTGGPNETTFGFLQDLDINGITSQRTKVSRQNFQSQIAQFSDFDRLFRLRLRQNYWSYLYVTELVNFQKEFYENYNDLLELNKFRSEKGDISPLEYDRLVLERVRIEKDYRDAEILRAQIAKTLRVLIGTYPTGKVLKLKGSLSFYSTNELGLNMNDYNIEDRPDLVALKSKLIQNNLNIELKKRESKSYLNIGGEVRQKGPESFLGVFATIPLRIFDRGQGEILKAEELYKKTSLEVEAKRREIVAEVRAAKRELRSREELLLQYRKIHLIEKNKDIQEKSRLAYIRGASNLVTFLEAERNFLNVLKNNFELIYLYYLSIEKFRASIGKLGNHLLGYEGKN